MDHSASTEQDLGFDLESGIGVIQNNEEGCPDANQDEKLAKTVFVKICDGFSTEDNSSVKSDLNEASQENNVNRKKTPSAKKPPRPPKTFSLDAYDQKLIKELAELAIIKRARIERMKALKHKKNSKILSSSSSSFSSSSSLFAMLFTIIFFVVILLQGRNSGVTLQGSPQMAQTDGNGLIAIQNQVNKSASDSISPNYKF